MREIKFRAWHKKEKRMFHAESILISFKRYSGELQLGLARKSNTEYHGYTPTKLDLVELMQYTGLKDKGGNKIYEGDIIKYHKKPEVVEWRRVGWEPFISWYGLDYPDGYQVIGNIYENKELLND